MHYFSRGWLGTTAQERDKNKAQEHKLRTCDDDETILMIWIIYPAMRRPKGKEALLSLRGRRLFSIKWCYPEAV